MAVLSCYLRPVWLSEGPAAVRGMTAVVADGVSGYSQMSSCPSLVLIFCNTFSASSMLRQASRNRFLPDLRFQTAGLPDLVMMISQ